MSTYITVFGGTAIYPSDVSYLGLALTGNVTLEWPLEASTANDVVARIIDVTSTGAYAITMPPADQTGTGQTTQFTNLSAYTVTVKDSDGGTIAALASGTSWQVYITDNSDAAGGWRTLQYGATVSQAQASSLAGYGLVALSSMLAQSMPVTVFNSNYTWTPADRAATFVWTDGAGTLTLPTASSASSDWFAAVRNEGSGNLTVTPQGLETINSTTSLVLVPGDSATVFTDGSNFYTLGLGKDAVFAFDYTSIDLTGISGNYTLSGSELNRISYTFTGVITGNVEIVVPKTTQQYWVGNDTTGGSYTLRVRTSTQSPGLLVERGARAILLCDGNNVLDADTASIAVPIAIVDGGTGSTTAGGALINLGGTGTGIAIFTAADAAAARLAAGAAASGANSDITSLTGLATPLSIAQGGTAAITAAAARASLSAAILGANNDITSLSGLTTPLSVAQGGSGAATLTGIVKGDGTSAFTAVTAPSGTIVGTTDTQTLTNKRTDPRVISAASASSLTPDISAADQYCYTALAANLTINAPTGTPVNGNKLLFRFVDNATPRTLTWNAAFKAVGVALPTTTLASKTVYIGCIYNSATSKWDAVAVSQEA